MGFDAQPAIGRTLSKPIKDRPVGFIHAELRAATGFGYSRFGRPRVFAGRIEARSSEVQSERSPGVIEHFRFDTCEDPESLCVSFKPTERESPVVEGFLAVVPKGWVAQIVSQAGRVNEVGVEPQTRSDFATNLSYFEGMGEPVPGEIEACGRRQHLRFRSQSSKRAGVQQAPSIARKVGPFALSSFGERPFAIEVGIAVTRHCGSIRCRRARACDRRRSRVSSTNRRATLVAWEFRRDRAGPRRRHRDRANHGRGRREWRPFL